MRTSTIEDRGVPPGEDPDETADLRTTQTFSGHTLIESTVGYARSTKTRLKAAVKTLNYGEAG